MVYIIRSQSWVLGIELDEDSKPLTAFTVGPLGFYECERIPYGLTNVPGMFDVLWKPV